MTTAALAARLDRIADRAGSIRIITVATAEAARGYPNLPRLLVVITGISRAPDDPVPRHA